MIFVVFSVSSSGVGIWGDVCDGDSSCGGTSSTAGGFGFSCRDGGAGGDVDVADGMIL